MDLDNDRGWGVRRDRLGTPTGQAVKAARVESITKLHGPNVVEYTMLKVAMQLEACKALNSAPLALPFLPHPLLVLLFSITSPPPVCVRGYTLSNPSILILPKYPSCPRSKF